MCLGVPGQIVEITDSHELTRSGLVNFNGIRKEVNLSMVEEAALGDYVVVHAGFALSKVDEQEARKIFDFLQAMGQEESEMGDS